MTKVSIIQLGAHFLTRNSYKVYPTNELLTNHYFCKGKDHDYN